MKLCIKTLSVAILFFFCGCYADSVRYYSQAPTNQDRFLNENIFHNKTGGTFIDIGAHDGMTYSNTYFFEKYLGWNGICFEPLPDQFEKLKAARKCLCINAAVSNVEGFFEFVRAHGKTDHTEMLSGLKSTYAPEHFARLKTEIERDGGTFEIVKVPTVNLNDVLKKNKISIIDYLTIDTEGHELPILKSIDYDTFTVYAMTVENNYNDDSINAFLKTKGFKRIAKRDSDEFYINEKVGLGSVKKEAPRLLIKIPTRSRPQKFFEMLDKFYANLSNEVPYTFLISLDEDDASMNNPAVIEKLSKYSHLFFYFGKGASKVEAYNRDIEKHSVFDVLLVASDDLEPVEYAFDLIILEEMLGVFPDFDGVLCFSNEFHYSNANIAPVMGKRFYDRFGYVYNPQYKSLYCDNELTDVARKLHKNFDSNIVLMRHNHPAFGRAALDALYVRNENPQLTSQDYVLYKERKKRGFDIK